MARPVVVWPSEPCESSQRQAIDREMHTRQEPLRLGRRGSRAMRQNRCGLRTPLLRDASSINRLLAVAISPLHLASFPTVILGLGDDVADVNAAGEAAIGEGQRHGARSTCQRCGTQGGFQQTRVLVHFAASDIRDCDADQAPHLTAHSTQSTVRADASSVSCHASIPGGRLSSSQVLWR